MIGCEYFDNFLSLFLHHNLSTFICRLLIIPVNYIPLILSRKTGLSTILYFGAKLISLYLFSAKKRGNLSFLWLITLWISHDWPFF